jgi:hypothetical protein
MNFTRPLVQENTPHLRLSHTLASQKNSLPGSQSFFKKCIQGKPGLESELRGARPPREGSITTQSQAETEVARGKEEGKEEDAEAVVGFFFFGLQGGEEEKKMKEEKNCKAWRVPPTPSSHTHARTHTHKL